MRFPRLLKTLSTGLAIAATTLATLPAHAVAVTWYITGHLDPANNGSALSADVRALLPDNAVFYVAYTFDSAAPGLALSSTRKDYVSSSPALAGGTVLDVAGLHYTTTSSRIIEEITDTGTTRGERLTLNANGPLAGGALPAGYTTAAMDALVIATQIPNASATNPYPWFGASMPRINALPDLSLSNAMTPTFDLFFLNDSTGASVHRFGIVDAMQTTPFAPVPEPASAWLMAAGLLAGAWRLRRT